MKYVLFPQNTSCYFPFLYSQNFSWFYLLMKKNFSVIHYFTRYICYYYLLYNQCSSSRETIVKTQCNCYMEYLVRWEQIFILSYREKSLVTTGLYIYCKEFYFSTIKIVLWNYLVLHYTYNLRTFGCKSYSRKEL